MSWFNRRPRPKDAPVLAPQTSSPMTEKNLKEGKLKVRSLEPKNSKKK